MIESSRSLFQLAWGVKEILTIPHSILAVQQRAAPARATGNLHSSRSGSAEPRHARREFVRPALQSALLVSRTHGDTRPLRGSQRPEDDNASLWPPVRGHPR